MTIPIWSWYVLKVFVSKQKIITMRNTAVKLRRTEVNQMWSSAVAYPPQILMFCVFWEDFLLTTVLKRDYLSYCILPVGLNHFTLTSLNRFSLNVLFCSFSHHSEIATATLQYQVNSLASEQGLIPRYSMYVLDISAWLKRQGLKNLFLQTTFTLYS